ncbi:MAG: immunoglobulin domain-containing protein [Ignavibacteria bacterium]|nr:immunoglobulin domain-containing protein [Ignavibacteria bacterium]
MMKTLLRSILFTFLLSVVGISVQAQCYYGYGTIYGYDPYGGSYAQGTQMYVQWDIYDLYYNDIWPPIGSTISIDISTDGGYTWNEVVTGLDMEEGNPSGWGYFYGYTNVTIPWTLTPSTNCYVRLREVPNNSSDCSYLYDGYNQYYYYGIPFTITPGCYQPAITVQPANQNGCVGYPLTVNVGVDIGPGTPSMQYEWYKGTTLYSTSTSTKSLSFSSIQTGDAGTYYLIVKNLCGKQVTSRTLTLTVQSPAKFTQQPTGMTICPGASGTLTAVATGTNLTYQWMKDGAVLPGSTQSTFSIQNATTNDNGTYKVIITAACGPADTSNDAVVVVPSPPIIVQQPVGGGFCPGSNVTITPVISGTGLSYQWYKGSQMIIGATTVTLNFPSLQPSESGYYWLKIKGGVGACVSTTSTEQVNVYTIGQPVITEQPKATDICAGSQGELIVSANGADLAYQWYRNGVPVPNSNNYMLILTNATSGMSGDYRVDVRSACNGLVSSSSVRVDVLKLPVISSHPVGADLQVGNTLTLTVNASDARTITWYRNEMEIASGPSNTLTITNVAITDAGYYRAVVSNVCGPTTSRSAKVTVTDPASLVPILDITSENLNLGDVPYGYNTTQTFSNVFVNTGTAALNVSNLSFSGTNASDFSVVSGGAPFTLQPLESRTIDIRYTPGRVGSSAAQLLITSNATPSTRNLSVQGNGVLLYSLGSGLSFGDVMLTQSKTLCLDVTNTSSKQIVIDQINNSSADFTVTTQTPLTVAAGASESVCIDFAPRALGLSSTAISFMSSTGGNSSTTAQGNGVQIVSVDEDATAAGIAVYPNPTTWTISIKTGDNVARRITLVDLNGRTIASVIPSNAIFSWDLNTAAGSPLAAGAYTLRIEMERGMYAMQVMVSR